MADRPGRAARRGRRRAVPRRAALTSTATVELAAKFGPEDERTLRAQNHMATGLRYLGRYSEAHYLDRSSFEVARQRYGADDPLTLEHAHLYAIDLRLGGDLRAAADLDRDTLGRKKIVLGEDHLSTLGTHAALAVDDLELGRCQRAREALAAIVDRLRSLVHTGHPALIENLRMLAAAERQCGAYERAVELSELALSAFRQRYGDSMFTRCAELDHAVNLRCAGDLTSALELSQLALERHKSLVGPDHPQTCVAKTNLAVVLRLIGRTHEAQELDTEALEALSAALGPDHPYSLKCTINLASDMFAAEDLTGAYETDEATLGQCFHKLGENHPTTLACGLNLALDLRAIGHIQDAERAFTKVSAVYRRVLGEDHPLTVRAARQVRAHCEITPIPA